MKKLLVMAIALVLVGCNSNEVNVRPTEIPEDIATPKPTEEVNEPVATPHPDSKINIDLYKVDEYYPIMDGVVTYPDGTTEEFNHGIYVENLGGWENEEDRYLFMIYSIDFNDEYLSLFDNSDDCYSTGSGNECSRLKFINDRFPVFVALDIPEGFSFRESTLIEGNVFDGIIGVEYENEDGKVLPYVVYRFSNYLPQGYNINESFELKTEDEDFYVWRFDEYDGLVDEIRPEYIDEGAISLYHQKTIIHWQFLSEGGMHGVWQQ